MGGTRWPPLEERLLAKLDKNGPIPLHRPELGPCWEWMGCRLPEGYGRLYGNGRYLLAHRATYELWQAPIASGMTLDHLCRNPSCCNPSHLEPVTHHENVLRGLAPSAVNARKTHCINGHEFTKDNTYWNGPNKSYRSCRTCRKANKMKQRLVGEWQPT